jgi:hypothetical protein
MGDDGGGKAEPRLKDEFRMERQGRPFVLYAGLLDYGHQLGLKGICTTLVQVPNELNGQVAIVFAQVEMPTGTFTGLGDASPQNVNRQMATALIRLAETRAKARALRDATNIGVTALEELGGEDGEPASEELPPTAPARPPVPAVDREGPPTADQKRALLALAKRAGVDVRADDLTYGQAAEQIVRLQRTLESRRQADTQVSGQGGQGAGK